MATRFDNDPKALTRSRRRRVPSTRGTGLTRRVKDAIEHLVHGTAATFEQACGMVQPPLTTRALRLAMRKQGVREYWRAECEALRDGTRAANLKALIGIRDDERLQESAAGAKARIEAVRAIEHQPGDQRGGVHVNVGMQVANVTPGYQIDASKYDPADIARILKDAGSTDSHLKRTIEGRAEEIAPRGYHEPRPKG